MRLVPIKVARTQARVTGVEWQSSVTLITGASLSPVLVLGVMEH